MAARLRVARAASAHYELERDWQIWLVNNRLRGADPADLVAALVENGVPHPVALREVDRLERSGALHVCRWHSRQREALARRFEVLTALRRLTGEVERRPKIDGAQFFANFFSTNTPLVLTDQIGDWPALRRWSPQYFIERHADVPLQVMEGRNASVRAERDYGRLSRETTLGEFAQRVLASGATNDFYAVARNNNARSAGLETLRADVLPPAELFRAGDGIAQAQSFWFGPAGTVTGLHHDPTNILFCQVYGKKRIHLAPPTDLPLLAKAEGFFSGVTGVPDSAQLPTTPVYEVVLGPGDALFIPALWWHRVEALSISISYSLLHFHKPNHFVGYAP